MNLESYFLARTIRPFLATCCERLLPRGFAHTALFPVRDDAATERLLSRIATHTFRECISLGYPHKSVKTALSRTLSFHQTVPARSQTNQGFVKSVKMADNGTMQQGCHRSFTLRAESTGERDTWVDALRAEVPAFHMELSASRSLSATPATSSAPTPIGTPSESGRRSGKFSASGRTRSRRATIDLEASAKMQPPVIRGWARTQSDQHQVGKCLDVAGSLCRR